MHVTEVDHQTIIRELYEVEAGVIRMNHLVSRWATITRSLTILFALVAVLTATASYLDLAKSSSDGLTFYSTSMPQANSTTTSDQ